MKIYLLVLALTALGLGFSNDIMSNFFKDAYRVNAYQRGFIEFPREAPGMLCILAISLLSFLSDIRIALLAQLLSFMGIAILGLFTPPFAVMLAFIFVNSLGMHLFFPLQDSIGLDLIKDGRVGKRMGQFKGISTAFQMAAAALVFLGFRSGIFTFERRVKWPFLAAGLVFIVVFALLWYLNRLLRNPRTHHARGRLVVRREYRYYYVLVIMFGVQKQIMMVYGPWMLIDLLGKKADTIALLAMIGGAIGMFFIPALGRWLDRFGIKAMLYADALSFIGVYLLYGLLSAGFAAGGLHRWGVPVLLAYVIFILDRMSTQMGLVRTIYLRTIAVSPADITPSLSLGLSLDHVVSIACAYLGGLVWVTWGPQYIFFLAAALSLVNLYVAVRVQLPPGTAAPPALALAEGLGITGDDD
jgi:predicted MFS family arabinose efflux permease